MIARANQTRRPSPSACRAVFLGLLPAIEEQARFASRSLQPAKSSLPRSSPTAGPRSSDSLSVACSTSFTRLRWLNSRSARSVTVAALVPSSVSGMCLARTARHARAHRRAARQVRPWQRLLGRSDCRRPKGRSR